MQDGKITIARLVQKYQGKAYSVADVVTGLNPQMYKPIFLYLKKNSEKPNPLEQEGYKIFYISRNKRSKVTDLCAIWKLARILKQEKVDILHCHRHKSTVYGTIASMIAGTAVVFSHVHGLNRTRNLRRKLINTLILRRVDKILTAGQAVRTNVLEANPTVNPEKVVSLPNSIDYETFARLPISREQAKEAIGLSSQSFVVGTVGRLAPTKGQTYLIQAFEQIRHRVPSAHLVLVGAGPLQNELEQQAAQTPFAHSIHFLGHRDDIPELLRAIDVFVLPSIAEGLPVSLLEAMAAGVPCVATKVGGIPEIINGEDIGLLVPPRDCGALAEAMIKVANMPKHELGKLVEKAQNRVRRFYSHEIVVEKLQNLYENELRT